MCNELISTRLHELTELSLSRYMKGTVEHGMILGVVDEIVLTLDDNSMNLQSMSASRYVGPFLEKVQKWEKSLSHISEVVEVRICMYVSLLLCNTCSYYAAVIPAL